MDDQKMKIISDICPFYKEYGTCEQCNTALDIDDEPCYWECMANEIIRNNYRKQIEGEWKKDEVGETLCSQCGVRPLYRKSGTTFATTFYPTRSNFCPNCGARMRKECEGK